MSQFLSRTAKRLLDADGNVLTVRTIADGEFLKRSGNDIVGDAGDGMVHIGGNFVDTTDQAIAVADTPQVVTFNKNPLIDDISHTVGTSVFTINTDGVYRIIVAPQLAQGTGGATVEFWLRKNGTDIVDSGVQITVSSNSERLPLLRWKERFVVTDTLEVVWASTSMNTKLDNIASLFSGPNIPSITFGVTQSGS